MFPRLSSVLAAPAYTFIFSPVVTYPLVVYVALTPTMGGVAVALKSVFMCVLNARVSTEDARSLCPYLPDENTENQKLLSSPDRCWDHQKWLPKAM